MRLTLASKSSQDSRNKGLSTERAINVYPVPAMDGALAQFELRSVPGLISLCKLPGPFFRAFRRNGDFLFAVCKGKVYRIRRSGFFRLMGAIPDDPQTDISGNRDTVVITAGGDYFNLDSGHITQPDGGRLTAEGSLAFLNQFTVIGARGGREIEWTQAGLPAKRDGLYFATAEANDDEIVRVMAVGGYVAVFKEESSELWANSGAGSSALSRVPGGVLQTGLKAFNLATIAGDQLFFIGNDNVAYITGGGQPTAVSTPSVAQALARATPTHCFYYEDRGHRFCVVRFSDRPAWVYDIAMGAWHERAEGTEHGPWSIIAAEYCYGRWHLASYTGEIFILTFDPIDAGQPMRRTIVSREVYNEGQMFTVAELEILGRFAHSITESGPDVLIGQDDLSIRDQVGDPVLSEEQDTLPTERPTRVWIRVSADGGQTFGLPKHRDVARKGQHAARCRWTALGRHRRFCVEFNITDPVEIPIQSEANIRVA